jgi:hypothetical protein
LPALLFRGAFPFSIIEVSPVTLFVVNTIPLGGVVTDLDLTSGGTEWLLTLNTGTQRQLVSLVGPVLAPNVVSNLPGANPLFELITPLSSASIRKAYLFQGASSLTPFTTDPTAALSTAVSLPLSPRIVLSN